MKKKILMVVGIIAFLFVTLIAYLVINDLREEKKLKQELNEITELVTDSKADMQEVRKKLDTIVTKDDYAKVEKAAKRYLSDAFDNIVDMAVLLQDEKMTDILTVSNYNEDGPDFLRTKKYINDTKESLAECRDKYYEYFTEEKALSYIDTKNLDNYYIDFYKKEVIGDVSIEGKDKKIENSINEVIKMLDDEDKIIDFLIANKGKWNVSGNNIVFDTDEMVNEYNKMLINAGFLEDNDNL